MPASVNKGKWREVVSFLIEFKDIVVNGRGLDVIPTPKNRQALLDLGLTEKIRQTEILTLTVENYCSGPEPDRDRPGAVWKFGKEIDGIEVYIKLKIAKVDGTKVAKCISFHAAESPLSYPLK